MKTTDKAEDGTTVMSELMDSSFNDYFLTLLKD